MNESRDRAASRDQDGGGSSAHPHGGSRRADPPAFADLEPGAYELPPGLSQRLVSPALVVFMEQVRHNVRTMLAHVGAPDRWRPHVKTTKLPAVWDELLGAGVRHFKCATAREARHLLATARAHGTPGIDLVLAYPRIGPELTLLAALADEHPASLLSVLVEDPAEVERLHPGLGVLVDVNPGMHRTGIPVDDPERILAVARAAGERFGGVHYYDGHLHEGDARQRRRDVFACYEPLMALLADFDAQGLPVAEVVTSGTPTFLQALEYAPLAERADTVHRVSPGTVVFHDLRSEQENEGLGLRPAALVFSRVVSHPVGGVVTCDAGSKSIAAEAGDPVAFVLGHPGLRPLTPSEEHLPLALDGEAPPARGSELLLVPRHVCPTVNLAEQALLIEADGSHATAAVVARAHDLLIALPGRPQD